MISCEFCKDICNEWFMLHSTEPVTAIEVKSEILWNNICITVDRSHINLNTFMQYGEWYRNYIVYVKHLREQKWDLL